MGANILIVEDEEPLTTLLRYNLEAEGYEVDAVARGDDADTRLKDTAPDLVLLDGVWGSEVYIDERTVDVHVGRLRKALNRGHATDPIRTVRGAGYSLDDRFGKTA